MNQFSKLKVAFSAVKIDLLTFQPYKWAVQYFMTNETKSAENIGVFYDLLGSGDKKKFKALMIAVSVAILSVIFISLRLAYELIDWVHSIWGQLNIKLFSILGTIAVLIISVFLYGFKRRYQWLYGIVEISAAMMCCYLTFKNVFGQTISTITAIVPLVTTIYFAYRGLANLLDGIKVISDQEIWQSRIRKDQVLKAGLRRISKARSVEEEICTYYYIKEPERMLKRLEYSDQTIWKAKTLDMEEFEVPASHSLVIKALETGEKCQGWDYRQFPQKSKDQKYADLFKDFRAK